MIESPSILLLSAGCCDALIESNGAICDGCGQSIEPVADTPDRDKGFQFNVS
jgi:hypothetical protein